ncbi:50S ribosomal protein L15 [Synechococcus sp. O70.2]|jgi:large subunit ribosomal protein L15|uniref:50S ribosomal protein L15 n=1 Tax=unclassified Synechococcus TaxID=2626047 RepID=UPI0039C07824
MRLEDIRPQPGSKRRRRRLGRGIAAGQGGSCGRGMRGQKARSGGGPRPGFEGGQTPLYRRLPKLKHFPRYVRRPQYTLVNLRALATLPAGSEVTLESLMELGIVTTNDGPLKILGDGEVRVPLTIRAAAITASAKAKVEAAGGRVEIVGSRPARS